MGEPQIWRIKYTWAEPVGNAYQTAFGQILVEETDFERAVASARSYWKLHNFDRVIQSVENLGPLVVRL